MKIWCRGCNREFVPDSQTDESFVEESMLVVDPDGTRHENVNYAHPKSDCDVLEE